MLASIRFFIPEQITHKKPEAIDAEKQQKKKSYFIPQQPTLRLRKGFHHEASEKGRRRLK